MANGDSVSIDFQAEGAEEITQQLDGLVEALGNVEKAGDIDLDNFVSSLEEGGSAAEELVSAQESLVSSFDDTASGVESAASAAQELSSEFQNTASTATEFAGATEEAAASTESLASGVSPLSGILGEAAGATTEVSSALTETAGAMSETEGATGALSSAMTETGGSAGELSSAMTETSGAMTEVVGTSGEAATGLQEVGTSTTDLSTGMAEVTTSTTDASTGFTEFNTSTAETATQLETVNTATVDTATAVEELSTSAETASTGMQSFNQNIDMSIGFMGNAAGSAVGLVTGFVRLEQAQNRVQRSTIQVSKAQESLEKAQAKLVTLQSSGSASATELANAQRDVEQASDTLTQKQGALEVQQANLNLRMTDFYATIGPNIITTVTSIIAGVSQMPQAFGRIAAALGNATISTDSYSISSEGASQATSEFGLDLNDGSTSLNTFGNDVGTTTGGLTNLTRGFGSSLKVLGVFGAIIGIAAVALGVIATNTFGARDALNQFGLALGQALPPLQGLLVGIQNLAVDIGIAGDDAKAQVTNFQTLEQGIVSMGNSMVTTGTQMETSSSAMVSRTGGALTQLGETFKKSGAVIATETSGWGAALDQFSAALGRQDWGTALDLLIAGFVSVGTVIVESLRIANAAIDTGVSAMIGFIQDFAFNAANIILEAFKELGALITESILGEANAWQEEFRALPGKLADAFLGEANAIQQEFIAFFGRIGVGLDQFVANAQSAVDQVIAALDSVGGATAIVDFFTQTIPQAIDGAWQSFQQFVQGLDIPPPNVIADFFTQTVPEAIGGAIEWVGKLHADMQKDPPKPLQTFFTEMLPQAIQGAITSVQGFIAELQKEPPHPIVDFFLNTIPQGIQGAIEWVGKLHADMQKDPPKPLQTFFLETLPQGIQGAIDWVGQLHANMAKDPPQPLSIFFTQTLPQGIQTAWDKFGQFIDDMQKEPPAPLTTFFTQTLPTAIQGAWDKLTGFTAELAKDPPKTIADFFTNTVVPAIQTAIDKVVDFFATIAKKGVTPEEPETAAGQPTALQMDQQAVMDPQTRMNQFNASAVGGLNQMVNTVGKYERALTGVVPAIEQTSASTAKANVSAALWANNIVNSATPATQTLGKTVGSLPMAFSNMTNSINPASTNLANYINQGLGAQESNAALAASTTPVVNNFQAARNIIPAFNEALAAAGGDIKQLTPEYSAYGAAIQTATNHNVRLSNAVLASQPATIAFGEALAANTGEFQKNFGAASGYIAAMDQTKNITGLSQQGVINFSDALKGAKAETDRLTTGQKTANMTMLGTQLAYTHMTQATFDQAIANQKEAQSLALGNILKADSNRATIALAEAQTAGTQKGVEFANSQFTAQASLTGYRGALSQAIAGNTQYGDSLGLTTQQLENQLSFQNDVVAAQEEIINVGAEVVNNNNIQAEAWRTMSQEQLNNINTTNQQRAAWIQLKNPLADTADNLQAVNQAFLQGGEAANEFMLNLRTTSAEADGYKKRLNELIPEQQRVGDTAGYTVEQMERLATAFSGTSAAAQQMGASMVEAASSFIGMLKFDPEELHTKIDDAFKDVPDWIQDNFSHSLKGGLVAQGDIERLGTQFVQQTGAAITGAFRTEDPMKDIRGFTDALVEDFEQLDPEVQAALAPMMEHIKEIGKIAQVSGIDVLPQQFQEIGQQFTLAAVEAEKAVDPFTKFYDSIGGITNITPQAAANIATLDGGLKSLSEQGLGASLGLAEVGTQAQAGQVPMVELTNSAGDVVGQFANINGTLVPVNQGLSALVPASQLAGNALLGVGAFANAVVIRFGDIQESLVVTSDTMGSFITIMGAHTATLITYFGTSIPVAFMATQNAMVMFTTMFVANFAILIAQMGLHVTTLNTYFLTTIPMAFMASQNAMVMFTTMFVANFALLIAQTALHVTTLNTYFTLTIPMAFMATQNAWVLFSTMFIANFAVMIAQAGLHTTTLNTYFTTTIPVALMAAQNAWVQFSTTFLANFAVMIAQAGAHVTTINTYFTQTIPQALATGAQAFTTSTNAMSTSVLTLRNNVQQAASDISSSFGEITSAASSMASSVTSSMNATSTAALTLRNNVEQLASDFGSAMEEMTDHVESFAEAFVSSMEDVTSAAEDATQAVEDLQSAIDSLQDKTVTITVQYKEVGRPSGVQHGGSFIVDKPTRMGGVRMGEFHKPELVTVLPLTNPNKVSEKSIDISRLISATGKQVGMQQGGRIINAGRPEGNQDMVKTLIREVIKLRQVVASQNLTANTILDGRLIDQQIQKTRFRRQETFG